MGIEGMDHAEAMVLIEELRDFATRDEFVVRLRWRSGDAALWHNPLRHALRHTVRRRKVPPRHASNQLRPSGPGLRPRHRDSNLRPSGYEFGCNMTTHMRRRAIDRHIP